MERDLSRALLYLAVNNGDYTQAQHRLSAAIERFPKQHTRGKTLAIANLALEDFPDLEQADILAALEYAAAAVQERELPLTAR
ncbi:MAG: hypothetical protein ACRDUV_19060 [Pseudonocardiaceae bacterium]